MTRLAILDIGTNSIHMVLAEVEPDFSYKILDRFKDMTRLGDGTFQSRRLSDDAMARGLAVIQNMIVLAHNKGYERVEAVATSAVREAKNGGVFIDAIAQQTGLTVRVVTGHEEARLIYLGVRHSMDFSDRSTLVVDVGGGSVELIAGNRKTMVYGQSLKIGAIRLKDLFLTHDPPTKSMVHDMQKMIDDQLRGAWRRLKTRRFDRIVATSGMAANLAEIIYLRRTGKPLPQLNLATVSLKEMRAVETRLKQTEVKDRLAIPGMDPKRADTLLPACMVIRTLMERAGGHILTLSDQAIREGLIYDFIRRHREGLRAEQEIPNVRLRNVISLARRCHSSVSHTKHVAKLALRLFDETRSIHALDARAREWLEYASILHDVGYLINARQHHKHTHYIITHSHLPGLRAEEIEVIANIARYHRRSLPGRHHEAFQTLTPGNRRTVETLSALLRMADALDRSQFSVIQDLAVKPGKRILITVHTAGDPELELWAARNRVDLFEKVFKRPVEFVVRRSEGEIA